MAEWQPEKEKYKSACYTYSQKSIIAHAASGPKTASKQAEDLPASGDYGIGCHLSCPAYTLIPILLSAFSVCSSRLA